MLTLEQMGAVMAAARMVNELNAEQMGDLVAELTPEAFAELRNAIEGGA